MTPIHCLVFGATGRTGSAFVGQAVAAGHRVTAFVRNAATELPGAVEVTTGDVLDRASVAAAVRAEHIVIIALGGVEALTTGGANVVAAAVSAGARRVLGVVGAGVLPADATRVRSELPDYPPRLQPIGAAHRALYHALRDSSLDWTLACTPRISDAPRTDAYRSSADALPDGTGAISTEDIAAFLLVESVESKFVRRRVGLNGTK